MSIIEAVCRNSCHSFRKIPVPFIRLVEGCGVEGDAHFGELVQHRSRVALDATQPNLRQVHLIHGELHDELRDRGFDIQPGQMGENITTRGVDLLALPTDTIFTVGSDAVLKITGLRNPCGQLDSFCAGLMAAVLDRDAEGMVRRKPGVMAVVLEGGDIRAKDNIRIELPQPPHRRLECV